MGKMSKQEQAERIDIMARVYAETNSAKYLTLAKSIKGIWYFYSVPMTAANVAAAMSTVEECDEGYKARFRPSNSAFYKLAYMNDTAPLQFADDETVMSIAHAIERKTGIRANKGNAVECILYERMTHKPWSYETRQAGFWITPDATDNDGDTFQIKAYGGSVTTKDLQAAIEYHRNK